MQLDPLEFQVQTEQLDAAITKLGTLQTAVQKLSKDTSSQSDLQVAKETNKVLIENATAQSKLIEIETKRLANQKKLDAAQSDTTEVAKKTNSVLERQTQIYENMIEYGLSKGQASTLAMAQAQKETADGSQKLIDVLKDMRKYIGGDTFDKSTAGMVAMQNRYDTLSIAAKNYKDVTSQLNTRQAQDLALDTERLAAKNQLLGITGNDAAESINKMTAAFKALAVQENEQARANDAHAALIKKNSDAMAAAERERLEAHLNSGQVLFETNQQRLKQDQQTHSAVMSEMSAYYSNIEKQDAAHQKILDKQAKNVVKNTTGDAATQAFIKDQENKVKALARAEEMLARLDNKIKQSTAETPLAQSAANQLFTYTKMLEKAGVAADVAKVKIEEFSKKQHAASALALADEEKKIKHLAASLAPQVTDVTVGLMTGQNPLTVFMQQGGQIRDQIGLSRVATEDLGKVFKLTIAGMIDMIMAMGAALIKFMFTPLGIVLSAVAALAAVITFLSGEMLKSEKQTVEITKALVGSGNAAGATADQMKEMAREASNASGISFDKSVGAMIEFAKTGEMTKEEFVQAAEAALLYERYMGVAVSESAKQLKELAEDPLKAVMKINEETGYFTDAIVRQVAELERLGLKEEAATLAKAEYSKATKQAAEEVRASMGYMLKFFDDIGLAATWMWDKITGVGAVQGIDKKIAAAVADVQSLAGAQAGQQGKGIFAIDFSSDIETAVSDLNALLKIQETANSKAEAQQKARGLSKDQADIEALTNKHMLKADTKVEERAKAVQLYIGLINDAASKGDAELQATIARRDKLLHDIDTGKKGDPKAKADTLSSLNLNLDNQTQQDEKQYQLKLRGIDNFTKQEQTRLQNSLTAKEITQGEFMVRELAMIAEGEQNKTNITSAQREIAAANVARDATTLTTSYNAWIDANKGTAGFADKNKDELEKVRSKVADLGRAYETATVAMDEQDKKAKELSKTLYEKQYAVMAGAIRSAKEELVKFGIAEAKLTQQRKAQVEVEDKLRYATPEQAAYIQAEATETARLTSEVQKYNEELRLQAENVAGAIAAGMKEIQQTNTISTATQDMIRLQQELYDIKLKNRDVIAGGIDIAGVTAGTAAVVKLQKDKLKELSDGVANSIEIGLFEGGEAGAKSLRNLVEAELRKPITIFIKAVVGDIVNLVSGTTGASGGSALSAVNGVSTAYNASGMLAGSYSAGSQYFAGTMSGANAVGTVGGNIYSGIGAGDGISGLLATNSAYGTASTGAAAGTAATGTLSTAIPYIGAFIAAVMILSQMGPTSARTLGSSKASYTDGKLVGTEALDGLIVRPSEKIQVDLAAEQANPTPWQYDWNTRGVQTSPLNSLQTELASSLAFEKMNKGADTGAKGFADLYFNIAKDLDIKTKDAAFSYVTNTGQSGEHPNVAFGVEIGGKKYNSGEAAFADPEVVKLAASRTMLEALRSSELPTYLAGVFDNLTTSTATQEQIDTVINLAKSYKSFHDTLQLLPFENLKDMTRAAAKALTEAAGGMEAFGAKLQSYYSNYYTAEEQKAQTIKNINTTLIGTGFDAATATRDTFRKLVESQDVTTESGRKTYTALMNVSEAFAGITPAIEDTSKAVDAATKVLKDLLDTATKAASSAFDVLKKSVELEKTKATELYTEKLAAYNLALTSTNDSISKLTTLAGTLKSTLSSLNIINSDEQQRTTAQASIRAALLQAQSGGGLPLNNELTPALSTITKPSEGLFSTFIEYARDFYKTSADIQALSDLTGTQLSIEEQNLAAVKQQITTLETNHIAELAKYDAILTLAQAQLDAANGINTSVLSIADALLALSESIAGLVSTRASQGLPTTGTTQSSSGQVVVGHGGITSVAPLVGSLDFSSVDAGMKSLYSTGSSNPEVLKALRDISVATGTSIGDIASKYGYSEYGLEQMFGKAGLPSFDVGTNYVPKDMLAQIHEGEAIIPRAYNPDANGTNAALVDEIRALRVQVADLQASNRETAQSTRNTDKTLVNVTRGGEAMLTQTA